MGNSIDKLGLHYNFPNPNTTHPSSTSPPTSRTKNDFKIQHDFFGVKYILLFLLSFFPLASPMIIKHGLFLHVYGEEVNSQEFIG